MENEKLDECKPQDDENPESQDQDSQGQNDAASDPPPTNPGDVPGPGRNP